ncbi:MAG: glycosyltransferase [Acidobacteria bacterium]|nr:glycosyltransferase [Acidobacteriota bacterium]
MNWADIILPILNLLIFGFFILLYLFYLFLLLVSVGGAYIQPRRAQLLVPGRLMDSVTTPPVTVLVAAHNEEATIVESVTALLALRYPRLEVIVINDGSTDKTLEDLIRRFSLRRDDLEVPGQLPTQPLRGFYLSTLDPRLVVIDKVQGGKSDALNAGLNLCWTPWVCTVDADSILEEDSLLRALRPALEDDQVVATSGIVRIANGCRVAGGRVVQVGLPREPLALYQVVEYLRGFLEGRLGWSWLNGLLIISGAFGLFRSDVLRAVGGYARDTVAEDMDVVVRIHRHFRELRKPYQVMFVPDPVCWTEVPTTAAALGRQRRRWHRGLAEVLSHHSNLFLRPRMGVLGWLVLPYFLLELVAPIVEMLGMVLVPALWGFGWLSNQAFVLYLILAFLVGTLFSLWAVLIEEFTYRRYTSWGELARLLLYSLTEHAGFHQMILWWRLRGVLDFFRGRREWGAQQRAGFRRRPAAVVKA